MSPELQPMALVLFSRVSIGIIGGSSVHVIRTYFLHIYTFWYNFYTVLCQFIGMSLGPRSSSNFEV